MKVQVNVKNQGKIEQQEDVDRSFQFVISPQDTALSVKERVLTVSPTPFTDQDLIFGGRVLSNGERLSDCGVQEGSSLDFVVRASEEALAQQLAELLQVRAVPLNELCLLYCHKYGVTIGQAFQALGQGDRQLHDFFKQKSFVLEDGCVSKAGAGATGKHSCAIGALRRIPESPSCQDRFPVTISVNLKTPSRAEEVNARTLVVGAADSVLSLKQRICAAELIPFPGGRLLASGEDLDDCWSLNDCGVKEGSSLDFVVWACEEAFAQQLSELLQAGALSLNELGMLYTTKHGATVSGVLKIFGWGEHLADFLKKHQAFSVEGRCVSLSCCVEASPPTTQLTASENQHYLDLHAKICNHSFAEEAAQALDRVVEVVKAATFLNVRRVVKGGSIGRGTAIRGIEDAEVVLILEGLPPTSQKSWLPALLQSAASSFEARLDGMPDVESVCLQGDAVRIHAKGSITVDLRFAPTFPSHREALDAIAAQAPEARPQCAAWLGEKRVRFIQKQPEAVKTTMRLLKWWREQRAWSAASTRPSDELLELVVAHVATRLPLSDQRGAVAAVLRVLAQFDTLQLSWLGTSACYAKEDVPQQLLRQQPLLMDPVNPFVNVADPLAFDSQEMMDFARSADFF